MSDGDCPSCSTRNEANGWKVAIVVANVALGLLITISIINLRSTRCIERTVARHVGEHSGILIQIKNNSDRISRIEAKR